MKEVRLKNQKMVNKEEDTNMPEESEENIYDVPDVAGGVRMRRPVLSQSFNAASNGSNLSPADRTKSLPPAPPKSPSRIGRKPVIRGNSGSYKERGNAIRRKFSNQKANEEDNVKVQSDQIFGGTFSCDKIWSF